MRTHCHLADEMHVLWLKGETLGICVPPACAARHSQNIVEPKVVCQCTDAFPLTHLIDLELH